VVDPGSADNSREIISRHKSRLAAIVLDGDQGPADGLNKGMALLSTPLVGYLNADDYYLPGALKEVVQLFNRRSGMDVAVGHGVIVDSNDRIVRHVRSTSFTPRRYARGAAVLVQQSTFFRLEAFKRAGGFNPGNRTCWDAELVMDMALTGASVELVNRYWGAFRHHEDSISGSGRLQRDYARDQARLMTKALGRDPGWRDAALAPLGRPRKWLRHPSTLGISLLERSLRPRF
jgi:glycosyltransferase involved in cell wall biosynthesis